MKRHAVPQNIMDVEFKLFGSLSIRQFGLLSINVVFALIVYATGLPGVLKWPIVIFFVGLGLAMALITVNGISFTTWLGNFLLAFLTSQKRVWKKSAKTPDILRGSYKAEGKYTTHKVSSARKALREMPLLSDEAINTTKKVDQSEEEDLLTIDKHLKQNYDGKELSPKNAPPPKESKQEPSNEESFTPITKKQDHNLAGSSALNRDDLVGNETGDSINVMKLEKNVKVNRPFKRRDTQKEPSLSPPETQEIQDETQQSTTISQDTNEVDKPTQQSSPEQNVESAQTDEVAVDNVEVKPVETPEEKVVEVTNVQDAQKVDEPQEESKQANLQKKIEELEAQLKQLQSSEGENDIEKQTEIVKEIDKASDEMKGANIEKADEEEQPENQDGLELTIKPAQRPNIVVGVVLSKDDQPIQDVTVEIKDDQNFPLRKVKTDTRGQFTIPTPLPNGEYLIDFEKKGRKFTDYRVRLRGQILPILKFKEQEA